MKTFLSGTEIRERREALGLTQKQVVERLGLTDPTNVSDWEHDRTAVPEKHHKSLLAILEVVSNKDTVKNEKVPLTRDRGLTIIREKIIARIASPTSGSEKEIEKIVLEEHSQRNGLPPKSDSIHRPIYGALRQLRREGRVERRENGWVFYPEYQRRFGDGYHQVYLFYNPRDKEEAGSRQKSIWACNIGSTARPVEERIREQTDQWTIAPVIALIFRETIEDWSLELEHRIHGILKLFDRPRSDLKGREWFDTSPDEVVRIYKFINKMNLKRLRNPYL